MRDIPVDEWEREGTKLFGPDRMEWSFVCPVCGHVAKVMDWRDAGAPDSAVAFSCVGRWIEGPKDAFRRDGEGPCSYAGGGLFKLNPINVVHADGHGAAMFDFARPKETRG